MDKCRKRYVRIQSNNPFNTFSDPHWFSCKVRSYPKRVSIAHPGGAGGTLFTLRRGFWKKEKWGEHRRSMSAWTASAGKMLSQFSSLADRDNCFQQQDCAGMYQ